MEMRKLLLMSSVLVIWILAGAFGYPNHASGRAAKILEDPTVPQSSWSHDSYEKVSLYDASDRSLQVENNMMLYRSVFALSLKLLSVFLIIKLFSYGLGGAGILRSKPYLHQQHGQPLYTVDVNHNPVPTSLVSHTSTGAAAGASTGGAAGVVGLAAQGQAQVVPAGGYLTPAATNPRPAFLLPRFRFGARHPQIRPRHPHYPPQMLPVSQHNMGETTHLVETHSHVYVMPDGSQSVRVPIATSTSIIQNAQKPSSIPSPQTAQSAQSNPKPSGDSASAASSTSDNATVEPANSDNNAGDSSASTSASSSSSAERRSSLVFREKVPQLHHQHYDDWSHFNPGTRSL